MDSVSSSASPAGSGVQLAPQPLRFTGKGSDYFGIWIVNLLLTIVTLGVYSSWAKVRRLHYFYRHTELAGSSFDFHGKPVKIFIGRLIALAMLIGYNYSIRLQSRVTLLVLLALALVLPWLLRNSFRFRLYNTSWRGARFHFRGSVAGAYRVFLLNGLLALITLYVMAPFFHQRLKAYQHDNSWFGRTKFSFHAGAGSFYLLYLVLFGSVVAFFIVMGVAGVGGNLIAMFQSQKQGGHMDPRVVFRTIAILYGALIVTSVLIGPTFHALVTNLIWNNTRLGEHRIECKMAPLRLIWITVSNLVLVVLTLGLYIPWAAVRLAKYQMECMRLIPASDLQEFVDTDPESVGAIGEEAASVFDFDIAL